jgi:hypothetical protein
MLIRIFEIFFCIQIQYDFIFIFERPGCMYENKTF